MQKLELDSFWRISAEFIDAYGGVSRAEPTPGEPNEPLSATVQAALSEALKSLKEWCDEVGLTTSSMLIDAKLSKLPANSGEMDMLWLAAHLEMKDRLFLRVPSHRGKFFEKDDLLSEQARAAFPQAPQELREAGNCYAAGLPTACVFHCMRSLEYGLAALAKDVDASLDGTENWQNALDKIDKKIWPLATGPREPGKASRLQFLHEAAGEFRHFKDGWRNYVSHNKVTYDETQALRALEHVASFTEVLSSRLTEHLARG